MTLPVLLDRVRQDLRYGTRTLLNRPVFAICTIATLALGIGANTAIFTLVNSVLLRPLPYPDSHRLVRVSGGATFARFESIKTAESLASVAAFNVFTADVAFSGEGNEVPDGVKAVRVSSNLLSVLGVPPRVGKSLAAAGETDGSCAVMISERLWASRFGSRPAIVGSPVRIGGTSCAVAGVLPRAVAFPFPDVDIWLPLQPASMPLQSRLHSPTLAVIARLRPDVSLRQADEELKLVDARYRLANPAALDAKSGRPEHLVLLQDQIVAGVRPALSMLMGAAGFLLAIACANIAGLMLVRARLRSREVLVRLALGASRGRLKAQLVTESLIVALSGGALGVAGAAWAVRRIDSIPGLDLPLAAGIHLDGAVLLFAALLSISSAIVFGLTPSLFARRANLMTALRTGEEINGEGPGGGVVRVATGSRNLLVTVQVALSTVLLVGAVLLIVSVARLRQVDLGFDPRNLLTMRLTLPLGAAPGSGPDLDAVIERIKSVAGVRDAAVTLTLPTAGFAGTPVWPVNQAPPPLNRRPIAILQTVTPAYFRTMGIALRRGREFTASDSLHAPKVVIINEAAAKRFWPGYPREDPVGQLILAGASPDSLTIVGIASDVRQAGIAGNAAPGIYRPRSQVPPMSAMLAIRTRTGGDALGIANAVRAEVAAAGRGMSIAAVKTMDRLIGDSEAQRRGIMLLLGFFAATGLLLTALGIYGVIAYSVASRAREFGIRQALGARRFDVLRLVLGQGLKLAVAGSALGLIGAAAFARLLRSFLFEVQPDDPAIFAAVALLCVTVALGAGYVPARQAIRVEPAEALRGSKS